MVFRYFWSRTYGERLPNTIGFGDLRWGCILLVYLPLLRLLSVSLDFRIGMNMGLSQIKNNVIKTIIISHYPITPTTIINCSPQAQSPCTSPPE